MSRRMDYRELVEILEKFPRQGSCTIVLSGLEGLKAAHALLEMVKIGALMADGLLKLRLLGLCLSANYPACLSYYPRDGQGPGYVLTFRLGKVFLRKGEQREVVAKLLALMLQNLLFYDVRPAIRAVPEKRRRRVVHAK